MLLAGSRQSGEDLLPAALERAMRRWSKIQNERVIYIQRTLYHLAVDSWRARRRPMLAHHSVPAPRGA